MPVSSEKYEVKGVGMRQLLYVGASNFWRGLPAVWSATQADWGPIEILAACGHGRSYCGPSTLGLRWLHRTLPGIEHALSHQLCDQAEAPLQGVDAAVFGDLGNDLAYGFSSEAMLATLDDLIANLSATCPVVIMLPPTQAIISMNPRAFRLVAALVYPGRRIQRAEVIQQMSLLVDGLEARQMANPGRIKLLDTPRTWLGWDRIHVRRSKLPGWAELISESLRAWWKPEAREEAKQASGAASIGPLLQLTLRPSRYRVSCFGLEKDLGRAQPCFGEGERGRLFLY